MIGLGAQIACLLFFLIYFAFLLFSCLLCLFASFSGDFLCIEPTANFASHLRFTFYS